VAYNVVGSHAVSPEDLHHEQRCHRLRQLQGTLDKSSRPSRAASQPARWWRCQLSEARRSSL